MVQVLLNAEMLFEPSDASVIVMFEVGGKCRFVAEKRESPVRQEIQ